MGEALMNNRGFQAGDEVFVRFPEEILATLDGDGTLDGIPFMPEMLDSCGKPFRVQRRVEKTCVDGYSMRRFPANDVVILDGPRCDGSGHDGCMHRCRIFWKEAWLQPANAAVPTTGISETGTEGLRARLKVKSDEQHYFCQSTELYKSTEAFPGKRRLLTVRIALREIRSGDLSVLRVSILFARWILQKWLRAAGADERLRGSRKRTRNEALNLQPGERVRVKSRPRITETLNDDGRNRGLSICHEMTRCCGREAEVKDRVDRLINERTGLMVEISNTVTLKNIGGDKTLGDECLCKEELGDCPRGELMYWREIWLERR
ncbi:MAG TPA: hypothetical protein VFG55_06580 [Rhodanobacteraceae bacterium]|nr:hypothetical protein [Rhodanobacteraceae bacterium]